MKNKILTSIGFLSIVTLSAMPAYAKNNLDTVNPWTQCGIGAMIFKTHPVGAVISNIIWDYGTTAVTSAISSKGSCEGAKVEAALIINETYPTIADETAKGQGQNLSAVVNLLGCNTANEALVINGIRTDFAILVSAKDYETQAQVTKAQNYYNIVVNNVNTQCSAS